MSRSQKNIWTVLGSFLSTYSRLGLLSLLPFPFDSSSFPTQLPSTPQLSLVAVEASGFLAQLGDVVSGWAVLSAEMSSWLAGTVSSSLT